MKSLPPEKGIERVTKKIEVKLPARRAGLSGHVPVAWPRVRTVSFQDIQKGKQTLEHGTCRFERPLEGGRVCLLCCS